MLVPWRYVRRQYDMSCYYSGLFQAAVAQLYSDPDPDSTTCVSWSMLVPAPIAVSLPMTADLAMLTDSSL